MTDCSPTTQGSLHLPYGEVRLTVEPDAREPLQQAGLRLGRDGSARLRISGTSANPVVR